MKGAKATLEANFAKLTDMANEIKDLLRLVWAARQGSGNSLAGPSGPLASYRT